MSNGTMLRAAIVGGALIAMAAFAGQAEAASCGGATPWAGNFSGNKFDPVFEQYTPISAQGCFRTEQECRRFINRESGRTNGGPIRVLSCKRVG